MTEQQTSGQQGSGVTTSRIMRELHTTFAKKYEGVLQGLPKAKREVAMDGFRDGMRTMLNALVEMGIVVLEEQDSNE